ncbi:MAG TPA: hypothetical protein DCZ40_01130 [Lachnospiraceae bacterium]|nr:hypothetical protein [Lachnospiraceae bacterium]
MDSELLFLRIRNRAQPENIFPHAPRSRFTKTQQALGSKKLRQVLAFFKRLLRKYVLWLRSVSDIGEQQRFGYTVKGNRINDCKL